MTWRNAFHAKEPASPRDVNRVMSVLRSRGFEVETGGDGTISSVKDFLGVNLFGSFSSHEDDPAKFLPRSVLRSIESEFETVAALLAQKELVH